jgi:hypothetical protein
VKVQLELPTVGFPRSLSCGRRLKEAESIARGAGPACARRIQRLNPKAAQRPNPRRNK